MFCASIKVEVQGQSIFTLEETHHLFYLLCHSFKHFLHGGVRIRQICDMVQMIRVYGRKNRLGNVLAAVRRVSHDVFLYQSAGYRSGRYLGFSYEASGAVRAAKKLHRIPKRF